VVQAHEKLLAEGIRSRVVSMPSWDIFEHQTQEYRDSVLPPAVKARVAVEQASTFGWERYVGGFGRIIGMNTFGASAPLNFVVNMIGLVMVRELGPLLAAVLLAGRSGSAFAAEIGTMKVNEELDALQTLGLDPIRFLVIQRITASILLTPLLTVYATFLGVVGGVSVALGLGFPLSLIFHQLTSALRLSDVFLGVAKGVVFGAIVSAVGCLRGLQTQEGPSAVGVSTTRAVVTSIVLIVIADACFPFFSLCLNDERRSMKS
jgi:phospholipid/cholesterol/gamma-HCH transport system permease protein